MKVAARYHLLEVGVEEDEVDVIRVALRGHRNYIGAFDLCAETS